MSDTTHNVHTNFTVNDKATANLGTMAKAAARLSGAFSSASTLAGQFGSVAAITGGAFSIGHAISDTMKYVGEVKKVASITGLAAEKADGLLDSFEKAGVSSEDVSRAMIMMSKSGFKMELAMQSANGAASGTMGMMQKLGVDIRKGPEAAFMRLASLAQKNKLDVTTLAMLYRVPFNIAGKMYSVLKKGPEALKESMDELRKKGLAVTAENIQAYSKIITSQREIKSTWDRIMLVVGTKLLPVVGVMMKDVETKLAGWLDHAQEFGIALGAFLRDHLSTVMKTTKVLLLNYSLMKATGKGADEWGKKALAAVMTFAKGKKAGPASAVAEAAGEAISMKNGFAKAYGDRGGAAFTTGSKLSMGTALSAYKPKASIMSWSGLKAAFIAAGPVIKMLFRLSIVAVAIGIVVKLLTTAIAMVRDNVYGIRDEIMAFWEKAQARVQVIADLFAPVTKMFSREGAVGGFFSVLVPTIITTLTDMVDGILHIVQTIILVIKDVATDWKKAITDPIGLFTRNWALAEQMTKDKIQKNRYDKAFNESPELVDIVPKERAGPPQFHFHNARFDITQKFAEGFDPDRVAVAFTNDLAALADRRVQSGFSPLFGVR